MDSNRLAQTRDLAEQLLILTVSLLIIFKVRSQDTLWGLLAGFVAYGGAQLGGLYLAPKFSGMAGVYANLYSLIRNTPTQVILLPEVVFLVSGSKAYMGLDSMVTGQKFLSNAYKWR